MAHAKEVWLTTCNRSCIVSSNFLGYEGEDKVDKLVFTFTDGFVDGAPYLCIKRGDQTGFLNLTRVNETYEFPIETAILTQEGDITFQLVIASNDMIVKYDPFVMTVRDAIDADSEMPEDYPNWIDMANELLVGFVAAFYEFNQTMQDAEHLIEIMQRYANMGLAGELNGATFTPSVSQDGDLSWTNDKELPNPQTVNVKGAGVSSVTLISTVDRVKTYRMTFTDGTYFDFSVTDGRDGSEASGDMLKSVYDTDNDGVVDNAETLEGHPASYFQQKIDSNNKLEFSFINNVPAFITNTVDNLTNYYLKRETYTQAEVNALINTIQKVTIQIVQTLPQTGDSNVIYFVPKNGVTNDTYDEYIYISNSWEKIGSTDVDLTNYYTKSQIDTLLATKANSSEIPDELADLTQDSTHRTVTDAEKSTWTGKQDALSSGVNIKTINNQSLLGSGDINIPGGTPPDASENTKGIVYLTSSITPGSSSAVTSGAVYSICGNVESVLNTLNSGNGVSS